VGDKKWNLDNKGKKLPTLNNMINYMVSSAAEPEAPEVEIRNTIGHGADYDVEFNLMVDNWRVYLSSLDIEISEDMVSCALRFMNKADSWAPIEEEEEEPPIDLGVEE